MMLVEIAMLCYIFMAYGLTNLLVYGSGPFDVLIHFREWMGKIHRTLSDMLECMMCTSTNIGLLLSIINLIFIPNIPFTPFNYIFSDTSLWFLIIPFDACITSGCVWIIHTIQETLESITNKNNEL